MAKQIVFNEKARLALKRGVDKVANAVKVTLGPAAARWCLKNPMARRSSL